MDVLAGKNVGTHTALISDTGSERYGADIVAGSRLDAVEKILS